MSELKYWICPKCACLTLTERTYCDNCNCPQEALDLAEKLGYKKQVLTFKDELHLRSWLKLVKQYGWKVWIKGKKER